MTTPLPESELASINPGIRKTVQFLREHGFNTCDSGDGVTRDFECDPGYPYVAMMVDPGKIAEETDRLVEILVGQGVDFDNAPHPQIDPDGYDKHPNVDASYLPLQGGRAVIVVKNVIL